MSNDTVLAVDFGTSHSLVGAFRNGQRVEALPIDPYSSDKTLMRTLLYFANENECYYGADALKKYSEFEMEGRLFRSFKSHLPNKNYIGTIINNRILNLETLIGLFLLELKKRAEKILDTKIEKAVIGKPARYSMDDVADGFALHRMRKAAEYAGFKEVNFVPEPLAAALDFKRQISTEKTILIGDFGGGTSDFTVMKITRGEFKKSDVLGVDGCPLAGDALDSLFMQNRLNAGFGAKTVYRMPMSENLLKMPVAVMDRLNKPAHIVHLKEKETYEFIREVQRCALKEEDKRNIDRLFVLIEDQQIFPFFETIETTKKKLSASKTAKFDFDYPEIETSDVFSAHEFETWATDVKSQIFLALERCLKQSGLSVDAIDHVFLTGGTAHVPFIQNDFKKMFGAEKLQTKNFFHSILSGLIESAGKWGEF
jgi:hypothetical chaperone protein